MLKLGVVPTINLSKKSHETRLAVPRRSLLRIPIQKPEPEPEHHYAYKDLDDFKLNGWEQNEFESSEHFRYRTANYVIPEYEVIVNEELEFTCVCFGWVFSEDNCIYKLFCRSIRHHTISTLFAELTTSCNICKGVHENTNGAIRHTIPLTLDVVNLIPGSPNQCEIFYRSASCLVIDEKIQ